MLLHTVCVALSLTRLSAAASSFAGSTSTFQFPPANVTVTASDTFFPDAEQVGFAGPTPTGDEAAAIVTAPSVAKVEQAFPLVRPDTLDNQGTSFNVIDNWGNLSPFKSVASFGLPNASAAIPAGYTLTQVHLIHRHGARYPTSGAGPATFAAEIHAAATGPSFNATGPLEFMNTWTYKLGAEILTPFGREQLFNLGVGFRVKYGELLKGFDDLPVWRTTSEDRMVDSALHFAAGFFGVRRYTTDYHQLIEIEADGFNSTLAPYEVCPNANNNISSFGTVQATKWIAQYLVPAQKRLSPFIDGFNLTTMDVFNMQTLCAYETVSLGFSAFCDLFTEDEWKGFEYALDLQFWYGFGPGNPAVSAQGRGWVEELVSRLTQQRITSFGSSVNETIVSSDTTFPLNQPIFVDASHDIVITAIITAMNFTSLAANGPLPTDHIPENQTYIVNQLAPFASNLVGQVLSNDGSSNGTHIRWILNDGVVPLTGINGCTEDPNGLCDLPTFIAGMQQRIQEIDFDFDCFANFTIPDPDTITDGQFPQ
ncbi:phosphoglycerate mutase-like protein [Dendrothele bispora CBS 962.96]|uniref:Phosphoglycerate mutase-like protein n=1 Tax=Dendrothele bispora (strain CBS 962.96) TaxID=1314807 RepID=A0A4V4HIR4_DENBC|nr:phosphoglycerate mutase-like protein [Dendrothele bispora CBS 962.96]